MDTIPGTLFVVAAWAFPLVALRVLSAWQVLFEHVLRGLRETWLSTSRTKIPERMGDCLLYPPGK